MKHDPSGSQWRKWDLHFHTPASFDYKCMSITNDDIIKKLKNSGVAAVAITDHHRMDVDRIKSLQSLGGDEITVFPGIEFRSELGGSETVHFIGIFPENCNVETVWTKLKGKLGITEQDIDERGDDEFYVKFEEAAQVIHELGGLVSVHAGKKSNSIENIRNTAKFKMAFKKDLAQRHIDLLEVVSKADFESYRTRVFPEIGFPLPVIVGSDNHDIRSYDLSVPCWIKADCTFAGLTHVLHETEGRVFLGDLPPTLQRVSSNKTKYLKSISIRKSDNSSISENWFNCDLSLNHGLIAVVGNKGSGKSALADIVGLLGNTKNSFSFSFLSNKKFCQPKSNKAENFVATAVWETGLSYSRRLSDPVDVDDIEAVNYIPQDYLESVCNELGGDPNTGFGRALRQVIYSHVDAVNRLGFDSLDELLEYKTKETTQAIERSKSSLAMQIRCFLQLVEQASTSHRKSLNNQLAAKQAELSAHDAAKPVSVSKPTSDAEVQKLACDIEKEIANKIELAKKIESRVAELEIKKVGFAKHAAAADKLLNRMLNLQANVNTFVDESEADCRLLGVSVDQLLTFALNRSPVQEIRNDAGSNLRQIDGEIGSKDSKGLFFELTEARDSIKSLKDSLDAPNRRYQEHLSSLSEWEERQRNLTGPKELVGTLAYIEHQIKLLDDIPRKIDEAWEKCLNAAVAIHDEIQKLADAHRVAFEPVQSFIQNHALARNRFDLQFDATLVANGFTARFLAFINQGRRGSFCGVQEGIDRVEMLLDSSDFESRDGVRRFLEEIRASLTSDLRQNPPVAVPINDQLAKGQAAVDLFAYVLGLEYLKPQVTLKWAGKDIEQLSPGERGTLLLVFYLLIDKSDIPLVIDQPEENLDNQTVVDFLVPSVKEAKSRRQIVLITHNPNLAVVCDADQVICAFLDKNDGNRITYETGAIESPKINQRIVDILEGTRRAFDNRDGKYHAEKSQARPRHKAFPG
jgi:ABC-type lipoprotein export system ATPase subunit